jgi:phospholipid transport system substrate-binding protein
MTSRRHLLILAAAPALLPPIRSANAQGADKATAFVKATGDQLVAIVNGPGAAAAKRAQMTSVLTAAVDVDGIGRFCLGRFWRTASAEEQQAYLKLFRDVLVTSITAKLGEYQGVRFTMGRSRPQEEEAVVSTTVERPNNPPTAVDWIISNPASAPKIIDVVAEGTSLRLTQRQDYASYLSRNNSSVAALLKAMQNQIANLAN